MVPVGRFTVSLSRIRSERGERGEGFICATCRAIGKSHAVVLRYNRFVQKSHCPHRAEWRLLRGRPAQRLSVHYRLDCDYGTALITIYKEGDPVFLCAFHATAIGHSDDRCIAGVRLIDAESVEANDPLRNDERIKTLESAAKPSAYVPSKTAGGLAARKVERETNPTQRRPARDLTYGDCAKALVDETIWNMRTGDYDVYRTALEQGKPATEAAQSAGGQLAIVHRRISEYTLKIEAVLSESKATINVREVIDKPFEHAVLKIISNVAMSDAEKDAAMDHLGTFQQQINRGLDREVAPLQAYRIGRLIGDRASWGTRSCLSEELESTFRAVYASIRNALRAAVPEAYDLDERLANLCAARADLENAPPLTSGEPFPQSLWLI